MDERHRLVRPMLTVEGTSSTMLTSRSMSTSGPNARHIQRISLVSCVLENSCRSTSGSKACTGCHPSVLRIVQSFADRCPRHHHCPSHSEMPPIRELWELQRAWVSCKAPPAYAVGVAFAQEDAAPLLCRHYSGFITTTSGSVPLRRIATIGLAFRA